MLSRIGGRDVKEAVWNCLYHLFHKDLAIQFSRAVTKPKPVASKPKPKPAIAKPKPEPKPGLSKPRPKPKPRPSKPKPHLAKPKPKH